MLPTDLFVVSNIYPYFLLHLFSRTYNYYFISNFFFARKGDRASAPKIEIEDDSFFDITVSEAKNRHRQLISETKTLEEGGTLTTSKYKLSLEESKKLAKLTKYKKTVIRIQFPDR